MDGLSTAGFYFREGEREERGSDVQTHGRRETVPSTATALMHRGLSHVGPLVTSNSQGRVVYLLVV